MPDRPERLPISGTGDDVALVDPFQGVGDRADGHDPSRLVTVRGQQLQHSMDQRRRRERMQRIVDDDGCLVIGAITGGQQAERGKNAPARPRSTHGKQTHFDAVRTIKHLTHARQQGRRNRDEDAGDASGAGQGVNRPGDQRHTCEFTETGAASRSLPIVGDQR
jgi:hypothetical protein